MPWLLRVSWCGLLGLAVSAVNGIVRQVSVERRGPRAPGDTQAAAAGRGVGGEKLTEAKFKDLASAGAIGVALVVCDRVDYARRASASILKVNRDPEAFPLVVSQDGSDAAMERMIEETLVATGQALHLRHPHEEKEDFRYLTSVQLGYRRIAQHFGFIMRRMFDDLGFGGLIFVEEDLEIAPDFFSYFGATFPLLQNDDGLYCVSAWNDNGLESLVQDPKRLFRTDFFPGLGWMMAKKLWDELRINWPATNWDDALRMPHIRKGRQCIRPEISRSYTFGKDGTSGGEFFLEHLSGIKLNDVAVDWAREDIQYVSTSDKFDQKLLEELRNTSLVSIADIDGYAGRGRGLRVLYEPAVFKEVADKFNIMPDEREGTLRMSYRGVIPFVWYSNRVYLYTSKWPHDLNDAPTL